MAGAREERDAEREAAWLGWVEELAERCQEEDVPRHAVDHYVEEMELGLEDYYRQHGGRLTPTRKAWTGEQLRKHDPEIQLAAIEIYCDGHAGGKDQRYLVGIARRLARLSDSEYDVEIERHRKRQNGSGIFTAAFRKGPR